MAEVASPIRVVLADDQALFREAVRAVLDSHDDIESVGEAPDGMGAVAEAERTTPDIVLMNADLPDGDGVQAAHLIGERVPQTRVVILSTEEDVGELIEALEAGASGYVTKMSPLPDLIDAMRAISRGETKVPSQMLGPLLARLVPSRRQHDEGATRVATLTNREREILALLCEGENGGGIAETFVISPETARTHIQNVLAKLGVHSRLEAVAFARRTGLCQELEAVAVSVLPRERAGAWPAGRGGLDAAPRPGRGKEVRRCRPSGR